MAEAALAQVDQERRFVKITHSSDKTIAVDSSGQEWYYDKETGEFVTPDEYRESSRREYGSDDEDDLGSDKLVLPPEKRCTDKHIGDVIDLLGEVVVGFDQRIEGSITARKVVVKGLVIGNVVSYSTVRVESHAEVRGDVFAKEITTERGGRILGSKHEVPFPELIGEGGPGMPSGGTVFEALVLTGFFAFICLITIALVPDRLNRIVTRVEQGAVSSFFWGVLVWFSILPLFVLLIITIVGIPIAILVYPFALIAAVVLGYVAVALFIGKKVSPYFKWQDKSVYIKGLLGVCFLAALRILWSFFDSVGATGLDTFFMVIYIVLASVAITIGIGAVVSSKFGAVPRPAGPPRMGTPPEAPRPVPPVKPPPPPKTEPIPPQIITPPPPIPPPVPKSGNATDEG
jgi:hypothetical protein